MSETLNTDSIRSELSRRRLEAEATASEIATLQDRLELLQEIEVTTSMEGSFGKFFDITFRIPQTLLSSRSSPYDDIQPLLQAVLDDVGMRLLMSIAHPKAPEIT